MFEIQLSLEEVSIIIIGLKITVVNKDGKKGVWLDVILDKAQP